MQTDHHVHVSPGRVIAAGAVTVLAAMTELWVSWRAGSYFLIADAVHLLTHLGIFVVLLLPVRGRHAFREDALASGVLVIVISIALVIGVDSLKALRASGPPPHPSALLFSLCGLAANLASAWLFRDPARERWSFRAALAHELSDAALTVAGLLGAGVIAWFHFGWVDPGLSLIIAAWLATWSGRLLVARLRGGPGAWYQA